MATSAKEFYRKPLPSSCIDFASSEGKSIFKEALSDGGMSCFFNLAAQFRTQDEPAYCGLSTLVMVLNALSVDPGKVWKGPWRWYHENMLDCCVPLDLVKVEGISLFNFSCLALCNGLDVDMVQALSTASVEQFRDTLKNVTKSDSQVLVCSYSRQILGQTGDGHFSPIGGYHADRDLVLIFDVARFKYPPHWVSVDLLWKSMQGLDKETGQPRGYLTLSRTLHTGNPTILFKISENFNLVLPSDMKPELSEVLRLWHIWLISQCHEHHGKKEFLEILVSKFLSLWCSECFPGVDQICTMKLDVDCCNHLSEHHKCAICDLLRSLEKQHLFQIIDESLSRGEHVVPECGVDLVNLSIINEKLCCQPKDGAKNFPRIKLTHFATMMLLAWPYPTSNFQDHNSNSSHADFSIQYVGEEMAGVAEVLDNEVKLLKAQLSTVFTYLESLKKAEGLNKGCCEVAQCKN